MNNYPNEYPNNGNNNQMQQPKKDGANFLGGFFAGVVLSVVTACFVFTGMRFYQARQMQREEEARAEEEADSLVNDMTMGKLQVIEETIGKYY